MQEGLEGNPVAGTMKNVARVLAVLAVPFTMEFPKVNFPSLAFSGTNNFPCLPPVSAFVIIYCMSLERNCSSPFHLVTVPVKLVAFYIVNFSPDEIIAF